MATKSGEKLKIEFIYFPIHETKYLNILNNNVKEHNLVGRVIGTMMIDDRRIEN